MNYLESKWSLRGEEPYDEQVRIINRILYAMDNGYENIILEAGTGSGKSSIATTVANYVDNSYIITMTNQLLQQYLNDFDYMVEEIKGKDNYPCRFEPEVKGKCMVDEHNKKLLEDYNKKLTEHKNNPDTPKPERPKLSKNCGNRCPFIMALHNALDSSKTITNYDFLYYAGNFAGLLPERDLLILDESHNLEAKVMNLIIKTLNRKTIYQKYGIDIFDGITNGMKLKDIEQPAYWITICNRIINDVSGKMNTYIGELEEDYFKGTYHKSDEDLRQFETEILEKDKGIKNYNKTLNKYSEIIECLESEKWVIEVPTKKAILEDNTHITNAKAEGLKAEFKPLTIAEDTDSILHFGKTRLFLTGTLGNKEMFCKWIGIDPDKTFYIYQKSPFPVDNRPIIRCYLGKEEAFRMAGKNKQTKEPNWKNEEAMIAVHDILENHRHEKGVIHVSSNEQAWWIRNELNPYVRRPLRVASGKQREEMIETFENNDGNMVLISPSVKDGVDFKGDKCRFQIIFKCPFPLLKGKQVNRRKYHDQKWYIYQTVMPLMQAYGRGIRYADDWCKTYVIDSSMEGLLRDHIDLFNEYFLEAIDGFDYKKAIRDYELRNNGNGIKVKRMPRRVEAK